MQPINQTNYRQRLKDRLKSDINRCQEYLNLCFIKQLNDTANVNQWQEQEQQTRQEMEGIEVLLKRM